MSLPCEIWSRISIHALREEGDSIPRKGCIPLSIFLSTPSARRATGDPPSWTQESLISIHALREEGDDISSDCLTQNIVFLSTPSARRATALAVLFRVCPTLISIHALREEGDRVITNFDNYVRLFLSTPSARRATVEVKSLVQRRQFLSTPSARRATPTPVTGVPSPKHFYPRPPRGGRQEDTDLSSASVTISIHALREEGDPNSGATWATSSPFLSTPSARRATCR